MSKFQIAVVAPLLVAAIVAGASSIVRVARLEERVSFQKEMIVEINNNVKWIRDNWNKR